MRREKLVVIQGANKGCRLEVFVELQDFQSGYGRYSPVVGQKRAAACHQRHCYLNGIGRFESKVGAKLRRGFEDGAVDIDATEASTSRQ